MGVRWNEGKAERRPWGTWHILDAWALDCPGLWTVSPSPACSLALQADWPAPGQGLDHPLTHTACPRPLSPVLLGVPGSASRMTSSPRRPPHPGSASFEPLGWCSAGELDGGGRRGQAW